MTEQQSDVAGSEEPAKSRMEVFMPPPPHNAAPILQEQEQM